MKRSVLLASCLALLGGVIPRASALPLPLVPAEIASEHFVVTVDGQRTPVMHAALNLYFLNIPVKRHVSITVTADTDGFWDKGVEVQPWRLNIRPQRRGRTISFRLEREAKISISRPGDFGSEAEMLYLFANPVERNVPTASSARVHYFGPGVHHENIDAEEGDHIYLAEGAVVFGSLNVWQVNHVTVSGRGIIVYDGPQNPADDDGWMHKRNWHCIVMDNAHDIHIEGITCVVRSRTWQIQMKNSRGIVFDNIKVIGANKGNANADGMDWLGGGDTVVRNSFFRAADDLFALQTSWNGYGPVAFADQGEPVTNITIENNVLSTSISNIVRAGWPEKNFEGGNFLMRDSDVIHMGLGGCGIPFALMEIWADPNGRGQSADFRFENIRLERWYSLVQMMEPVPGISHVSFKNVAGLETPSLAPSVLKGEVHDVMLDGLEIAGSAVHEANELPILTQAGAEVPDFAGSGPQVHVTTTEGLIRPRHKVRFEAVLDGIDHPDAQYTWRFGDGRKAKGRKVAHAFPDTLGTLMDGSGRYRVLLEVTSAAGRHLWVDTPVVVTDTLRPAFALQPAAASVPGVSYTYQANGTDRDAETNLPTAGEARSPSLSDVSHAATHYRLAFEGDLTVPADGEYTLMLIANEAASLELDGENLASSRNPIVQVCGLAGMAAQAMPVYVALAKGMHHVRVTESHGEGQDDFRLLWQGPGFTLQPVPAGAWTHASSNGGATDSVH